MTYPPERETTTVVTEGGGAGWVVAVLLLLAIIAGTVFLFGDVLDGGDVNVTVDAPAVPVPESAPVQ